jgi:hypothetical protein
MSEDDNKRPVGNLVLTSDIHSVSQPSFNDKEWTETVYVTPVQKSVSILMSEGHFSVVE